MNSGLPYIWKLSTWLRLTLAIRLYYMVKSLERWSPNRIFAFSNQIVQLCLRTTIQNHFLSKNALFPSAFRSACLVHIITHTTILRYSTVALLKSDFYKKILAKPFGTHNSHFLPHWFHWLQWDRKCEFCVPNGFCKYFLIKNRL